jgi:predicted methyltransferase
MNRAIEKCVIKNSLHQSHDIVERTVKPGDTVIDATAGNGGDTVFLAGLAGPEGRVYSFDIQQAALDRTLEKLNAAGLAERAVLLCEGHENMAGHVKGEVSAIMFNLGYLPGGDHNIGTTGNTTVQALESAMELIKVNGIITVVVYYGGDSGFGEKEQVMEYIHTIDCKRFTVSATEFVNQINCPPILLCIEKLF